MRQDKQLQPNVFFKEVKSFSASTGQNPTTLGDATFTVRRPDSNERWTGSSEKDALLLLSHYAKHRGDFAEAISGKSTRTQ